MFGIKVDIMPDLYFLPMRLHFFMLGGYCPEHTEEPIPTLR
jgi:hypothetical protein